jgi:transcriptional regulator with XRE-family HTH domain
MSRSELVRLSGVSKQQLSRLENSQIRLRLDHLAPFTGALGYSAEQMLLWGRYPGTGEDATDSEGHAGVTVPELDTQRGRERAAGRSKDALKSEAWSLPASFVRDQLHSAAGRLVIIEVAGDSMAPTLVAGERVIVDTSHTTPSPNGLYSIRDSFHSILIRRLQALRATRPTRFKVIADNSRHPSEDVPLDELDIVGKVVCGLKLL